MKGFEAAATAFAAGLIIVALATTLVGPDKQTPAVLGAAGGAISGALLASQGQH